MPPSFPPLSTSPAPLFGAPLALGGWSDDELHEIAGLVARLRAEVAAAPDRTRRARLLYELGEVEERTFDEASAARDYLAAFNADNAFRESLEALVRMLDRRRSVKNLGRLVDALVKGAASAEERTRAFTMQAYHREDFADDLPGARQAAREATRAGGPPNDAAVAYLTLEYLAGKANDAPARARALEERTAFAGEPTWRALLLIDAARLLADEGDFTRGLSLLDRARELESDASFAAAFWTERLAQRARSKDPGRAPLAFDRAYVAALLHQVDLIDRALVKKESGGGSVARRAVGRVPPFRLSRLHLVDAQARAAEAELAVGALEPASALLDRALAALEAEAGAGKETGILVPLRLAVADRMGDRPRASALAERLRALETDGAVAASLSVRAAEGALEAGDTAGASEALSQALARDPKSIAAHALSLEMLMRGPDPAALAGPLETWSAQLPTAEARGNTLLVAAYLWATRAAHVGRAKAAVAGAVAAGVSPVYASRLARMLAAVLENSEWYEEATRHLLEALRARDAALPAEPSSADVSLAGPSSGHGRSIDDRQVAALWLDLARVRFARGDGGGGHEALRALGDTRAGGWIGLALTAYLPGTGEGLAAREAMAALETLAERASPELRRGLTLASAMRADAALERAFARERLAALAEEDPSDLLVASYLTDLAYADGEPRVAARVLFAAARAVALEEPEVAAAFRLEAGLSLFQAGDRKEALDTLVAAMTGLEEAFGVDAVRMAQAVRPLLGWALRASGDRTGRGGVDESDAHAVARREARAALYDDGAGLLEAWASALASKDSAYDEHALDVLDTHDGGLGLAAALARLISAPSDEAFDGPRAASLRAATRRLADASPEASTLAAAELTRQAREGAGSRADDASRRAPLEASRQWFASGGGAVAGLEWLANAIATDDPDEELAAREALATSFGGAMRDELTASSALLRHARSPFDLLPAITGSGDAVKLANLELAGPGSPPERRIAALTGLEEALGEAARVDALGLAGWSWLALGDGTGASAAFHEVCEARPEDVGAWEGLRLAAEVTGDVEANVRACEELGARCNDAARGAFFWERAGVLWSQLGNDSSAERAFREAFLRDPSRSVAFDRVFRRVRERKDGEALLVLIARRMDVTDDPPEIAKLFWEQARVLRERGDFDEALKALENVVMLEPDHVGALALSGEINIRRGRYEAAAESLARLALSSDAPAQSRVTAGVAAVDLFENKLEAVHRSLEILLALHRAKLSTLPVRERLARTAARTASWREATEILEELMHERPTSEGRVEAARLAIRLRLDRLNDPPGAVPATLVLLEEAPGDPQAVDLLLAQPTVMAARPDLVLRARTALLDQLSGDEPDEPTLMRLAAMARVANDSALEQVALSLAMALSIEEDAEEGLTAVRLLTVTSQKPRLPRAVLQPGALALLRAPGDGGALAEVFQLLAPVLAETIGPSLAATGVTKRERVDPRSGLPIWAEVNAWSTALGIAQLELYVGGGDPLGVQGFPASTPVLVVGSQVTAPLGARARGRVARELFALAAGTSSLRHRDEGPLLTALSVAARLAEVPLEGVTAPISPELERSIGKALPRRVKKALGDTLGRAAPELARFDAWAQAALLSQAQVALVAAGSIGAVLDGLRLTLAERPHGADAQDARALPLVRFFLSPSYLEVRRLFGLEASS